MRNAKRALILALAAALAAPAMGVAVMASQEIEKLDGIAGVDFTPGQTVITPSPDPNLPDIKNADIYFGEHKISAKTEIYDSTAHNDKPRQHAGFIVSAPNAAGWDVSVAITGFEVDGMDTLEHFQLNLTPDGAVQTTPDNELGVAPTAKPVTLSGGGDKETLGEAAPIFKAEKTQGLGMWGCNWKGRLTVPLDSVKGTGETTATMLWTLLPASVEE